MSESVFRLISTMVYKTRYHYKRAILDGLRSWIMVIQLFGVVYTNKQDIFNVLVPKGKITQSGKKVTTPNQKADKHANNHSWSKLPGNGNGNKNGNRYRFE